MLHANAAASFMSGVVGVDTPLSDCGHERSHNTGHTTRVAPLHLDAVAGPDTRRNSGHPSSLLLFSNSHGDLNTVAAPATPAPLSRESPDRPARTKRFDALLLDIQMRDINGDEVCRSLTQAGFDVPIIAMTGTVLANRVLFPLDLA